MSASIAEVLLESTRMLRRAGVPDARRDAGLLLALVLGRDRTFLITHAEDEVAPELTTQFRALLARRARGEPVQYLTGHQEFFGLDFEVSADVLIPRPETELLVEIALELSQTTAMPLICDVGTGSGCIAVSLLVNNESAHAVAVDVSQAALQMAERNATKHSVVHRLELKLSDCFSALEPEEQFDLIVSNPPYVAEIAMAGLQREVRNYEPPVALTPGGDGLAIVRRLIAEGHLFLKTGGHLLIEIGFDQRDAVMQLVDEQIWQLLDIHRDLQGIPRTVALRKL